MIHDLHFNDPKIGEQRCWVNRVMFMMGLTRTLDKGQPLYQDLGSHTWATSWPLLLKQVGLSTLTSPSWGSRICTSLVYAESNVVPRRGLSVTCMSNTLHTHTSTPVVRLPGELHVTCVLSLVWIRDHEEIMVLAMTALVFFLTGEWVLLCPDPCLRFTFNVGEQSLNMQTTIFYIHVFFSIAFDPFGVNIRLWCKL